MISFVKERGPVVMSVAKQFRKLAPLVSEALERTVYFEAGHYADVTKRLQLKGDAIEETTREKYPLVWLVMDFEEKFGNPDIYCELPNAQIIIANNTQMHYTQAERDALIFEPILYPIYSELLYQLKESSLFSISPLYAHSKTDRPYWGGQESGNSERNLFNDMIDAIQVRGLNIKVLKQDC